MEERQLYNIEFMCCNDKKHVSESVLNQIKHVLTDKHLPNVIFQEDSKLFEVNNCSIYGLYNEQVREEDEHVTYINKDAIGRIFKFSCNLNEEKHNPCDILMEESGDAIECLLFGFRIQRHGAAHRKLQL
ncbi:unnamed protein product, partial [Rotaria socialis]